jgi:hypothetical protein
MTEPRKPRRQRNGFMEGPDQIHRLNSIYRSQAFGNDRATSQARTGHEALDSVASPEPDQELDDSELSDAEQRSAIARERMRRQGFV